MATFVITRGGPYQHGFMGGVKLIILIVQPITIQFAVEYVRTISLARLSGLCLGGNLCQIYYIRRPITQYLSLALDVDTVQEACIQQSV